jgi:hypothetical protein
VVDREQEEWRRGKYLYTKSRTRVKAVSLLLEAHGAVLDTILGTKHAKLASSVLTI